MTRVAIVTGVNGGIGQAIAKHFAESGWKVYGTDRQDRARSDFLTGYVACDFRDASTFSPLIAKLAGGKAIDALVNNAAEQVVAPLEELAVEDWDRVFAVNVRAPFLLMQAVRSYLAERSGSIVNISSVHASASSPGMGCYAATKAALGALTRAAALEWGDDNIRVNAVLPGAIDSPMLRQHVDSEKRQHLVGRQALHHIGRPDDVAQAVLFLVDGQRAGFVTGQTFVVDGGALSRLSTE